ncbi:recombination regulator RecX [Aldersonia sp. NBC_00410]|uniref:regulatory protein RecX n=1 Tax=Aldersonia sp. NBC_00410 TaxID=2975954 RepID=UPI00225B9FFF|nr:regulatory protein RecX [Aldersonia sp. NBC_00410]MCX5045904.1 recombination regulator RecX [Aldersonia sp. NBC_00410]
MTRHDGDSVVTEPGGGTEAQAREACLRLLAARARSRAELEQRLAKRGFGIDVTERVLAWLTEHRLIDDAEFAEEWVQARHYNAGKGKAALAVELRNKGVAAEDAERALATITRDDERDQAAELVRKKLRTTKVAPAELDRAERDRLVRRLVGMLARRGYPQGMAFDVVRAELADCDFEGVQDLEDAQYD